MLRVNYKNRIGYCYLRDSDDKPKWKIWFCHANCVCAMVYFYKEISADDGKNHQMAQVNGFFTDMGHAKRCINRGFFDRYCRFNFYAKELDDRMWKMIRIMAKNGINITIK